MRPGAIGAYSVKDQARSFELVARALGDPASDRVQLAVVQIPDLVAVRADEVGMELGIGIVMPLVVADLADFGQQSQRQERVQGIVNGRQTEVGVIGVQAFEDVGRGGVFGVLGEQAADRQSS
jgi:hypothetical protein